MNEPVVYNYNVVRFLPYPETGEFVNVGITLFCPQLGLFDFRLETGKTKRVTDFFPELERRLLAAALVAFKAEADQFKRLFPEPGTRVFGFEAGYGMNAYAAFTRPREGLIRFSKPRTGLAAGDTTPELLLGTLFADNIQRQFAQEKEYRESQMQRRLQRDFVRAHLAAYYRSGHVGNEDYHVTFPFLYMREAKAVKAVKPLNLNKPDSTGIYDHGGEWCLRLRRLVKMGAAPEQVIVAIDRPTEEDGRLLRAATEVCNELRQIPNLTLVDFGATDAIIEAARVG